MSGQEMALADELREYTAIKFAGDCKCGNCQLIPRELIVRIIAALRRPSPTEPDIRAALAERLARAEQDRDSYKDQMIRAQMALHDARAALAPAQSDGAIYAAVSRNDMSAAERRDLDAAVDAAISPAGDTGREAEPVAWRYKCQDGSVVLMLKRLTDSQKARGYYTGEDGEDEVDGDEAVVGPFHWAEETPLYASPQPAARIGREEIARIIAQHLFNDCGFEACTEAEREPFLHAADAILSLTASAPAGGWQDIATIERCANVAKAMREKHGSPTGDAYSCGVWDQGVRIEQKIRALTARDAGSDVARAHGKTGISALGDANG